jgi:hypothetical protein
LLPFLNRARIAWCVHKDEVPGWLVFQVGSDGEVGRQQRVLQVRAAHGLVEVVELIQWGTLRQDPKFRPQ